MPTIKRMKRDPAMRFCAILTCLLVAGCDAWPTSVANESSMPIQFRWRYKDHGDWSAPVAISPSQSILLARAQYLEDFTGITVIEDGRSYTLSPGQMLAFRRVCARSPLDNITTLGDCELSYRTNGVFAVRRLR